MRRMILISLALACVAASVAGCSSDGDSAKGSTTTAEGDEFTVVDGDSSTTTKAPSSGATTSTTASDEVPEGGDPDEFCARVAEYQAQFASPTAYTAEMVTAIRTLRPYVPEELEDDLDLAAQLFATLVGKTFDEVASDPALSASVYTQEAVDSLQRLDAWLVSSCPDAPTSGVSP